MQSESKKTTLVVLTWVEKYVWLPDQSSLMNLSGCEIFSFLNCQLSHGSCKCQNIPLSVFQTNLRRDTCKTMLGSYQPSNCQTLFEFCLNFECSLNFAEKRTMGTHKTICVWRQENFQKRWMSDNSDFTRRWDRRMLVMLLKKNA